MGPGSTQEGGGLGRSSTLGLSVSLTASADKAPFPLHEGAATRDREPSAQSLPRPRRWRGTTIARDEDGGA